MENEGPVQRATVTGKSGRNRGLDTYTCYRQKIYTVC